MRGGWLRIGRWGARRGAGIPAGILACAALFLVLLPISAEERAVKNRVLPTYPEMARRLKISGIVRVKATVDPDGKVTDAKALDGNRMLSTAAEDAVRKWRFSTASAVSTVAVDVNFNLAQ